MSFSNNNEALILNKLGIKKLNSMQEDAKSTILKNNNTLILSPTGSGKTLAFLLPIIECLDPKIDEIQALIIAPTRELAIQIEQIARSMGTGYKTNVVYGGRPGAKDREQLKHLPALLIGTPGRIADRMRRDNFSMEYLKMIVLDEFDKSLEIGFESEMKEIIENIPLQIKKIFTSATKKVPIPSFINIENIKELDYLKNSDSKLLIQKIEYESNNKLNILLEFLCHIGNKTGIIFCNYKQSINDLSDYLNNKGISHACFYGGMEQIDRERALIKFRNGTHQLLIATDLAARGIDVNSISYIVHFEIPNREDEFIHRNGRTARMNKDGTAFILAKKNEMLPEFLSNIPITLLNSGTFPDKPKWETMFISAGRRDKISKGDIAGFLIKKGGLAFEEVGNIEIKHDCSFVAINEQKTNAVTKLLDNQRLKKKKIRIRIC